MTPRTVDWRRWVPAVMGASGCKRHAAPPNCKRVPLVLRAELLPDYEPSFVLAKCHDEISLVKRL